MAESELRVGTEGVAENLLDLITSIIGSWRKLKTRLLHLSCEGRRKRDGDEQKACGNHLQRRGSRENCLHSTSFNLAPYMALDYIYTVLPLYLFRIVRFFSFSDHTVRDSFG